MPTYQFICNDCSNDYEFFLMRMLRDSDKVCPKCGSTNVKQAYRDFFGFASPRSGGCSTDSGCGSGGGGYGGFR